MSRSGESGAEGTAEIPLFPLNAVLFPGGPLPLRIFEVRYLDMVRRCLRERGVFGVVLIRSGAEAGAVAETATIGTSARIVDFCQLADGLLGITCTGERKFRLLRRRQQPDGLYLGEIAWLSAEPRIEPPAELRHLGEILRQVLPQLGELYHALPKRFDDAAWIGCRLAEILPLPLADKQLCLEMDDPLARLRRLEPLIGQPEEG